MGKSNKVWMRGRLSALSLAAALGATPAFAQSDNNNGSIWQRSQLLGDIGGLRTALGNAGITFGLSDSENLLANVSGGVKTGATMQGVTTMSLDMDTQKAVGLPGGTFHVSALQLHGRPLSPYYLDTLQTANGNEGDNATRLWELWYDQSFAKGLFDIKIGQQSIDNEFIVSQYSGLFVNTMAGWPLIPSENLYGGGPAYPLSSLGVRLRFKPNSNTAILAGVFDDNPGGGAFSDNAQALDASGAKFNLNTGALWIAELQYSASPFGLPGTYKFGGWYDSGHFPDQLFGTDGLTFADPASNGNPRMHRGNYSLYGVVDQTVWQDAKDSSRNVNVFGRIMGAPSVQNLVTFFFNGGVTMAAPFPGRDNDQAGIDFGIGKVSSRAADLDEASGAPRRGTEELFELTYQAQVFPWLVAQPDIQYVIDPGAGALNPNDPTRKLDNELVIGARVVTTF
ncbi:MAG TPA: carbohydrate porin [Acidocella sp.]|jgi:porin|nr:carbohydrate porin [Acidocella sp.]